MTCAVLIMGRVFRWFYCLPIWEAVLLVLLATAGFLFLREKFEGVSGWKRVVTLLFLAWIAVILFATIGQRSEGSNLSEPVLMPFASYFAALNGGSKEIYRTNFMNVLLFYPAGLLGYEVLPKQWSNFWKVLMITVVFLLFSLGVEYVQYRFGLGLTETDDVIHNTLGALLGAVFWGVLIKKHKNNASPVQL